MTRRKKPFQTKYNLHGCVLESVPSAKYLGVTISEDLKWTDHINDISKKANQTLGFLKRNIRVHNRDLKSTAFKTLVRPQLEYASTVWSPYTDQDINKLESVQQRAARWVTRDCRYTSSVSAMLQDLSWRTLDQRRIAYWKRISNIFSFDPDSPRKNEKAKKFWSFVKSLKTMRLGSTRLG